MRIHFAPCLAGIRSFRGGEPFPSNAGDRGSGSFCIPVRRILHLIVAGPWRLAPRSLSVCFRRDVSDIRLRRVFSAFFPDLPESAAEKGHRGSGESG